MGIQRFMVQLHKWCRGKLLQAVKSAQRTRHVEQAGKLSRETKVILQKKQKLSHKAKVILQSKQEICLAKARIPRQQSKKNCDKMLWET